MPADRHEPRRRAGPDAARRQAPTARDLLSDLSTPSAPRRSPPGAQSCFEVYAGRHLWKLAGTIAAREPLETPIGKINSVRIDFTSARLDDPRVTRVTHFWISDDPRRLPLAAIAR